MAGAQRISNRRELDAAIAALAKSDRKLARIAERVGSLSLHRRKTGFSALAEIVVSQQLSAAAADTIFGRLSLCIVPFDPPTLLSTSEEVLRAAGLSAPKQRHLRAISARITGGMLDLARLSRLGDEEARAHMIETPGIGPWTAEIYLMSSLGRADIWPAGDIALVAAVTMSLGLKERPDTQAMARLGERYRPWRTIAARLFWADYRRAQLEARKRAALLGDAAKSRRAAAA
jgi:DNA-3-methyladenine glycosylase II